MPTGPRHRLAPPAPRTGSLRRRLVAGAALATAAATALGVTYAGAHGRPPVTQVLAAGEVSLWGGTATPRLGADADPKSVELGTRFSSAVPGTVTAVLFYKHAGNTGSHTGAVWNSAGQQLASVRFTAETPSGWQLARLATPLAIGAGQQYTVSYHAPNGRYADDVDYFIRPHVGGPLTATAGVYRYAAGPAYPTATWRGSNYYVDVAFSPGTPTTAAPPPTTTAPAPPATGFPGAGNTGWRPTGVQLTPMACPAGGEIRTVGTVIDGKDISCGLYVTASNVVIKRSRITTSSDYGIRLADGARNLVVQDTEIAGSGTSCDVGLAFSNWTGQRLDVHGCADGARTEGNVTLQDSWIHDLAHGDGAHNDALQATGSSNVVIRHNTLSNPRSQTSCILIGGEYGAPSNWLVEGNFFDGGNYSIYLDPNGSNRVIRDNVFARTFVYGALNLAGQATVSGNTYSDGKPLTG